MDEVKPPRRRSLDDDDMDEVHLWCLRRALEIGSTVSLKWRLKQYGPHLTKSDRPAVLREFASVLGDAARAFEIEETHGVGSLLNLDHPSVMKQIEEDRISTERVIPLSHVEAAERYRALRAVGV
jgi:hypothetical protein